MKTPLISVIIPTYNRPKLVKQAVASVLEQRGAFEIQIVVVDDADAPSYQLHDLVQLETPDRRILVLHTGHVGLVGARNLGIQGSMGTYVQFLDDDDIIYPEKLWNQINAAKRLPAGSVIVSPWCLRAPDGMLVYERFDAPQGDMRPRFMRENFAPIHAYLFPRIVLVKVGGFDPTSRGMEDWDLLARIALSRANFVSTGDVCCEYRFHDSNMMLDTAAVFDGAATWLQRIHHNAGIGASHESATAISTLCLMGYSHTRREQGINPAYSFLFKALRLLSERELVPLLGDAAIAAAQPTGSIFLPAQSMLEDHDSALDLVVAEIAEFLARQRLWRSRIPAVIEREIYSYLYSRW